ncbi:MAG: hypothetical protein HYS61_02980 [Acidobacteria bacterium]|nr:hypothetical protein [Acidobacteriota bacterium]
MPVLENALRRVVVALDKLAVPYALIGGLAVSARGAFRATKDVDLLLGRQMSETSALADTLGREGLNAEVRKGAFDDPLPVLVRVMIHEARTPVRCDLLFPSKPWQFGVVERGGKNAPQRFGSPEPLLGLLNSCDRDVRLFSRHPPHQFARGVRHPNGIGLPDAADS